MIEKFMAIALSWDETLIWSRAGLFYDIQCIICDAAGQEKALETRH
jgi:hypothetical protein